MTIADTLPDGLRPLQIAGALRIQSGNGVILADEPGAGKTLQALFALELRGLFRVQSAILILCNVTGCQLTWAPELVKRVLSQYPVVIADLTDTGGKATMPSVAKREQRLADLKMTAAEYGVPLIVLANYDMVRVSPQGKPVMATLQEIAWDAVIIDEAHLVLPTEADDRKKMTQFWRGLAMLDCYRDGVLRLPITGTPDRGARLERRYGTYKWLHPRSHRDYFAWMKANFRIRWDEVYTGRDERGRPRTVKVPVVTGLINEFAWNAYQAEHMIRRTKREMLKDLPPKQWAGDGGIDLPMTPLQKKFYDDTIADLKAEREALIAEGEEAKASAVQLQLALRARQAAVCSWDKTGTHWKPLALGKDYSSTLAWIIDEFMEPRGYLPGDDFDATLGKVVITSYFTEELSWLKAELAAVGVKAEIMEGDTPAPEKKAIEAAFQNGDLRVVLLSGHLGVSINLDAADDMIFIDLQKDADKVEQAEDRIHRASSNHQVTIWRLIPKGSIITEIVRELDRRYATTRASYDGARGADYERTFVRELLGLAA